MKVPALPAIGTRVGALASQKHGVALLFGYGTYQGEEVPPDEGGGSATGFCNSHRMKNPKIVLDNGDVVWGCECWWGPENEVKEGLKKGDLTVVEITIADFRAGRLPHVAAPAPKNDFWTA